MKIIIIGNGIAGNHIAFTIRKTDYKCDIKIISAEKYPEYDPCSLPYFIGGEVSRDLIFRKNTEDYKKNNINLILGNKVVSINSKTKTLMTENGDGYKYDKLILAYGGKQIVPDITGINKRGVFNCKQLSNADSLNDFNGKTSVVIGSGAIGIEVAEALRRKGYDVFIIELFDWIIPAMFDEPASKILEKALNSYNIKVFTGEKVISIDGNEKVTGVTTDKQKISCDTVVIATGVKIDKSLPMSAGVITERAIIVNNKMETNVNDIFACGDCAETIDALTGENCNYQLKHNALGQADIIAQNISGKNISYMGSYSFARAHFFKTYASSFGKTMRIMEGISDIEVIDRKNNNEYLRVILKSGKVIGAQAIGKYADSMGFLLSAMWQHKDMNEIRSNWQKIIQIDSPYPWTYRKLGQLLGFGQTTEIQKI